MCEQGAISAEPLQCDVFPVRGLMFATEHPTSNKEIIIPRNSEHLKTENNTLAIAWFLNWFDASETNMFWTQSSLAVIFARIS